MTPFEQAQKEVDEKTLQVPSVNYGSQQVNYFKYQLAVHRFNLKIMSSGMTCRGVKLRYLKDYYGLTGKSAKDCLPQFEKLVAEYNLKLIQKQ